MRRLLVTTLFLLIGMVTTANAQSAANMSQQDKVSYALGLQTGRAFKKHNVKINANLFTKGVTDGMTGKKSLLSDKEIKAVLTQFQKEQMAKMMKQMKQKAEANKTASEKFLAQNKKKPGVVTLKSGLQYKVLKKGTGPKPAAKDTVVVQYEGKLMNGKVFDSSYKRGKPATFPVNGVIKGWQQALQMMPVGSTWMIYIPPQLAYGARGVPGAIGPNQVLIFKVKLLKIKK